MAKRLLPITFMLLAAAGLMMALTAGAATEPERTQITDRIVDSISDAVILMRKMMHLSIKPEERCIRYAVLLNSSRDRRTLFKISTLSLSNINEISKIYERINSEILRDSLMEAIEEFEQLYLIDESWLQLNDCLAFWYSRFDEKARNFIEDPEREASLSQYKAITSQLYIWLINSKGPHPTLKGNELTKQIRKFVMDLVDNKQEVFDKLFPSSEEGAGKVGSEAAASVTDKTVTQSDISRSSSSSGSGSSGSSGGGSGSGDKVEQSSEEKSSELKSSEAERIEAELRAKIEAEVMAKAKAEAEQRLKVERQRIENEVAARIESEILAKQEAETKYKSTQATTIQSTGSEASPTNQSSSPSPSSPKANTYSNSVQSPPTQRIPEPVAGAPRRVPEQVNKIPAPGPTLMANANAASAYSNGAQSPLTQREPELVPLPQSQPQSQSQFPSPSQANAAITATINYNAPQRPPQTNDHNQEAPLIDEMDVLDVMTAGAHLLYKGLSKTAELKDRCEHYMRLFVTPKEKLSLEYIDELSESGSHIDSHSSNQDHSSPTMANDKEARRKFMAVVGAFDEEELGDDTWVELMDCLIEWQEFDPEVVQFINDPVRVEVYEYLIKMVEAQQNDHINSGQEQHRYEPQTPSINGNDEQQEVETQIESPLAANNYYYPNDQDYNDEERQIEETQIEPTTAANNYNQENNDTQQNQPNNDHEQEQQDEENDDQNYPINYQLNQQQEDQHDRQAVKDLVRRFEDRENQQQYNRGNSNKVQSSEPKRRRKREAMLMSDPRYLRSLKFLRY